MPPETSLRDTWVFIMHAQEIVVRFFRLNVHGSDIGAIDDTDRPAGAGECLMQVAAGGERFLLTQFEASRGGLPLAFR